MDNAAKGTPTEEKEHRPMSYQSSSSREHPSAYFIQDQASREELARLCLQDRLLTSAMGGVLPEQRNLIGLHRVLDVGCGPGGWLIEAAKAYPSLSFLMGVDISKRMIDCARAQAAAQQVCDRVEFAIMDALRMLEFPDNSFDLVNQRLGVSYLRTWEWSKLLDEYGRVIRPGGVIRITEPEMVPVSSSPTLTRLFHLLLKVFFQAGYLFTPESNGLTSKIPDLLGRHGFQETEAHICTIVHRAGTMEAQQGYENIKMLFRTAFPFLERWSRIPDDYEAMYQKALEEMRQPDFVMTSHLLTVWAKNVSRTRFTENPR